VRIVPLPRARPPHVAAALRSAAEALLCLLQALRAGGIPASGCSPQLQDDEHAPVSGSLPAAAANAPCSPAGMQAGQGPPGGGSNTNTSSPGCKGQRCVSAARSQGAATTLSFGSDALPCCWHSDSPISVTVMTRQVSLLLRGLLLAGRHHAALSIGARLCVCVCVCWSLAAVNKQQQCRTEPWPSGQMCRRHYPCVVVLLMSALLLNTPLPTPCRAPMAGYLRRLCTCPPATNHALCCSQCWCIFGCLGPD
jgi:hypothetical protein